MYLQSGKEFMLNATRIVFGLNSSGAMFPMYMGVKAMHPGFGALVQPITTDESFALFFKTSSTITACCTETFRLLGLSPSALSSEAIPMSQWIPNIAEVVDSPMAASIAVQVEMQNLSKVCLLQHITRCLFLYSSMYSWHCITI